MAVLKGDAYGLGLERMAKCLLGLGIRQFAVSEITEALELRKITETADGPGLTKTCRVLLTEGVSYLNISVVVQKDLDCFIWDVHTAALLNDEAARLRQIAHVHIKINTGMNRLGVSVDEFPDFLKTICGFRNLQVVGIASHLAKAESITDPLTQKQLNEFRKCVAATKKQMGESTFLAHLANSAACLLSHEFHFDMVRIGGALYGIAGVPSVTLPNLPGGALQDCVTVTGRVLQVRVLAEDEPISYGAKPYKATMPESGVVAIVNLGYGDGVPYNYSCSEEARVLVQGTRCRIVGKVCLGMTFVDVSEVPNVSTGENVVFVGRQGLDLITPQMVAEWSHSHPYKVLCDFGSSLVRGYTNR